MFFEFIRVRSIYNLKGDFSMCAVASTISIAHMKGHKGGTYTLENEQLETTKTQVLQKGFFLEKTSVLDMFRNYEKLTWRGCKTKIF